MTGQDSRLTVIRHDPDCFWLRATPSVDGDEGACCSCGAYADGAEVYALSRQLEGAVDALRKYGGCLEGCNALSGAPECSCGFDEAMLRALGRGGQ